jgi:hypothetical protein
MALMMLPLLLATINRRLELGDGLGVEGHRIQPRVYFRRVIAGETPVLHDLTVTYLKVPRPRESYEFTIDLLSTARQEGRPLEELLSDLDSARNSVTLVPFWYGRVATKNVRVLEMPSLESIQEGDVYADEREGYVKVKVAELL